jgi:proteasome beta subunit
MQGLVVIPILAGYDERASVGRIFKYDITGGRYEEDDYYATGSGGREARASLKKLYREGLTVEKGIQVGLNSLMDAADDDVGTAGPDLLRGIYPTVKVITRDGIRDVAEDEVRTTVEGLTSAPKEG